MNKKILSIIILAFGLITSSAVFAQQVTSKSGAATAPTDAQLDVASITFPISELGSCTDRESCRAYCNDLSHMNACVSFSEAHGLTTKDEASIAKKYILKVQNKETPGGCTSPESCNQYCQSISHLGECLSFAKENGVSDDNVEEGQQVATYLASGGKTPGGCDTKEACESYCADYNNVSECIAFAKNAGMLKRLANAQGLPEGQFEKLLQMTQDGQAPGACKSKDQCENYCKDKSHLNECVDFGVKVGFVDQKKADMIKAIGGKGPGGCDSEAACEAYCNQKENQQACFEFAEKYGLIPEDKLKEIKDGMGRLRSGINQMPTEAIACLKDNLGENIVGEIQSGNFTPGPQTGEIIKGCFDKVMPELQAKLKEGLNQADSATKQCLKEGLGEEGLNKIQSGEAPTPENGDVFRKCFENMQKEGLKKLQESIGKMPPEMKTCIESKLGANTMQKIESGQAVDLGADTGALIQGCVSEAQGALEQKMQEGLKNAPPELQGCIKSKLGNIGEKMKNGDLSGEADVQKLIQECVSNFKPQGASGGAGFEIPTQPAGSGKNIEFLGPPIKEGSGGGQGSSGGAVPPTGMGMGGDAVPKIDCSQFSMVPSCSYVPAGVAQDACKKCKSE